MFSQCQISAYGFPDLQKFAQFFLQATKGLLVYPENAVYVGMFTIQYSMYGIRIYEYK